MVSMNVLYMDLVNYVILLCSFIPVWVLFVLGWQVVSPDSISSHNNESMVVEFLWTVFPTLAVVVLCFLNLQCVSYDFLDVGCKIVKVVGRQWYWSYDVSGLGSYDSVMCDVLSGVDNPLCLTLWEFHRFMVTSSDVIHSFSIPEFNIKVDAIPGRLNYVNYCPDRYGIFVGYCTELCGAGHAYMPVVVEVIKQGLFKLE
uniref:Cytochrome c oxidase subunit 2 n=1 Tax=Uvitellina sp. SSS-2019 TaxID=2587434 RepID=A0A4Y5RCR3_9TREM|nr:cytochrome c oxidase subunit II [Uvitellina sp. SSS-2019]QCY72820.1 cytochrome c oxidase subunit 2 [Uvitellina sp. SSS-2019]